MKRFFALEYRDDKGWYAGKLKEIPGVFSQAKTIDELEKTLDKPMSLYKLQLKELEIQI